jgi:Rps23 Pro-64 3,4-dihydroxylase Tpa1-like proline 4-hydroxylase
MSDCVFPLDPDTLNIAYQQAKEIGERLAGSYQGKEPYDYGCFDNFLPIKILERVRDEVLSMKVQAPEHASANEHLKSSFNPDRLPNYTKAVFHALNSRPFIQFLENMSGIKGLIPDPYYMGGGIHRTENGGFLDIHADFNHHRVMNLERRMNILIYLNPDWKEEYGGSFEIWSNDMSRKVEAFAPVMNRMCCFSTGDDTMHGNPEPVNHPSGQPRLSIALYYYTSTWQEGRTAQSTIFKRRPGMNDAYSGDATIRVVRDLVPPILYRHTARFQRRVQNWLGKTEKKL